MSFYSFRFFPHHIHGSRLLTRFLHSANQLMHRLEIHFFLVRSLFFSQAYAALHPIFLSSWLCNKTLILLSILENPKADFSIDIRFLQDIILHSPSLLSYLLLFPAGKYSFISSHWLSVKSLVYLISLLYHFFLMWTSTYWTVLNIPDNRCYHVLCVLHFSFHE